MRPSALCSTGHDVAYPNTPSETRTVAGGWTLEGNPPIQRDHLGTSPHRTNLTDTMPTCIAPATLATVTGARKDDVLAELDRQYRQ
jgi:hypothetical protein